MDYIIQKHLKGKQKRNYFTKDTENAIVRYNKSTSSQEKSNIYEEFIHFLFFKLNQKKNNTFYF